jgi:uncharacterized protein DUF1579
MRGTWIKIWCVASLAAAVVALPLAAQSPPGQKEMSAEEKAMMDAMMKAATPGKQHQWLATKAGMWSFTGKFWQAPGAPPVEMSGAAERTMMLGGRVMAEKVSSAGFMGQPFEGYGLAGYDNVAKAFWGTWNDNMGTGVMLSKGQCDDKGACTYTGEYFDPMTGKMKKSRMTARDDGPDKEMHEFFDTGPDGKEFKSMELVYTRKK